MGNIIVGTVLLAAVVAVIAKMIINKKKGKSSCGCGCSSCGTGGTCHCNDK